MKKISEVKINYLDTENYEARDNKGNIYSCKNPSAGRVEIKYRDGTRKTFSVLEAPVFNSQTMVNQAIVRQPPMLIGSQKKKSEVYF